MNQRIKGAMLQAEEKIEAAKPVADNLEPYRRLIELQKQMIELVQRHERTKRECTVLRERLLEETTRSRRRWNLRLSLGWPAGNWLKGFTRARKSRIAGRPQPNGSPLPSF
jgi:hypothetical protein